MKNMICIIHITPLYGKLVDRKKVCMSSRNHLDIDTQQVLTNLKNLKQLAPGRMIYGVLKADGYGIGALPIYETIKDEIDAICVAIPEEARDLVEYGVQKPILCLGYVGEEWYEYFLQNQIAQGLYSLDQALNLEAYAKEKNGIFPVHITLDTGHSRVGFLWNDPELYTDLKAVSAMEHLKIEGTYTHFSCSDEVENPFNDVQISRFKIITEKMQKESLPTGTIHMANDGGLIAYTDSSLFKGVRIGIGLYGLYPSKEVEALGKVDLKPILTWKAVISHVKWIEEGEGVSYGHTFIAPKRTKVATIQAGYADGYPRALSNKGRVLIHGISCPVIGRVCMDQMMVDASAVSDVSPGDEATLLGEGIAIEELSELSDTISYEILTGFSPRISRNF